MHVIRGLRTLVVSALACCASSASADDTVQAVWQQHQMTFGYRSAGAVHTCAGLRAQLRSLLRVLGAHNTMTVTVDGCESDTVTRIVSVAFATPIEATAENLSALAARDTRTQLAARVRGESTVQAMPRFSAQWKTISFANALSLRLTPADCELLQLLRRELMPKLAVHIVRDRMRCASELGSGYRPQLVVTALVRVPAAARVRRG